MKKTICLILLSIFLILGFGSEKVLALKNNGKSSLNGTSWRSEERRVGKECISRWSPYH